MLLWYLLKYFRKCKAESKQDLMKLSVLVEKVLYLASVT